MGYPVVHFEINTASQSDLARFYEEAFGWTTHADGDDYLQINTNGVCAGTGEPGIEGGIGPSDPGDDFVTFYVQVPGRGRDARAGGRAGSGGRHARNRGGTRRHRDHPRPARQSHRPRAGLMSEPGSRGRQEGGTEDAGPDINNLRAAVRELQDAVVKLAEEIDRDRE